MTNILADQRGLRILIYAAAALIGATATATGFTTAQEAETWLEKVPAIAATVASLLAMANITPQNKNPRPNPTAEYARRIQGE